MLLGFEPPLSGAPASQDTVYSPAGIGPVILAANDRVSGRERTGPIGTAPEGPRSEIASRAGSSPSLNVSTISPGAVVGTASFFGLLSTRVR